MKKTIRLLTITFPNTIGIDPSEMPEGTRIPVASLTEEEALEYASFLKEEFLKHWKELRSNIVEGKIFNQKLKP